MSRGAIIVLPFFAAALAPALIATVLAGFLGGDLAAAAWVGLAVFIVAAAHVVMLGVPMYAFLHWRNFVRWWSLTAMGFVAGCIPASILFWPPRYERRQYASSWQEDGVWTMINGMPTLAGWWNFAQEMSLFGAFGAAGALAMWFTRKRLTSTDK